MQCSRCGAKESMALQMDVNGQVSCLDCLTRMDFKFRQAETMRSCFKCGNTDSLWYSRTQEGRTLCLCCTQKKESSNAKTWLTELDRFFARPDALALFRAAEADPCALVGF